MFARFVVAVLAMVAVVTASNILVQYPVQADLGPIRLADILMYRNKLDDRAHPPA